jgi:hypothetical protein
VTDTGSRTEQLLQSLTPDQRALLERRMRGVAPSPAVAEAALPPVPTEPVPVSAEQRQIVFHTLFAPGNPFYNEAVTIIRTGDLDVACLRSALEQLVARHDIWHTTFGRVRHEAYQFVQPVPTFELPVVDLRDLPADERDARAAELVVAEAQRPYDLKEGPLLRPLLMRLADDEHRLYLAMHHIIFDGVTLARVILPELVALYDAALAGTPSPLPPAVQYAQYSTWQREGALEDQLQRHLPYWRGLLQDAPTLALPISRPRPAEPRHHGTREWLRFPADLVARLAATSARSGGTLFHALVAGYARLLQEWGGQEDIVLSTVADLRRRQEFESMVGYCLTPVPLRLRFPRHLPTDELIGIVRGELLDALSHPVPFEALVEDLNPAHEAGSSPIFQTQIVLEPQGARVDPQWSLQQLDPRIGQFAAPAKNDIQIELDERPEGHITGCLIFNTDLFEPGFGARAVADWTRLLEDLAAP